MKIARYIFLLGFPCLAVIPLIIVSGCTGGGGGCSDNLLRVPGNATILSSGPNSVRYQSGCTVTTVTRVRCGFANVKIDGSGCSSSLSLLMNKIPEGVTPNYRVEVSEQYKSSDFKLIDKVVGIEYFDSISWIIGTSSTGNTLNDENTLYDMSWSGTRYVAVGGKDGLNGLIMTSQDGAIWAPQVSYTIHRLNGVTWSGNKFVAVGSAGTVLTSLDSVNWLPQSSGTTSGLNDIAWSGKQFVAVGDGGTILTSTGGITWIRQASPIVDALIHVVWTGTQFVSTGRSGAIFFSADGKAWREQ